MTILSDFSELVQINPITTCWRWCGSKHPDGYGVIGSTPAHRVAYLLFVGPIPDGMTVDHGCQNRLCLNPAHLSLKTLEDNGRDTAPYVRTESVVSLALAENPHHGPDTLLTPAEVAQRLRVDSKTVTRWATAGRLTCIRTPGGHRRYRESEVTALGG